MKLPWRPGRAMTPRMHEPLPIAEPLRALPAPVALAAAFLGSLTAVSLAGCLSLLPGPATRPSPLPGLARDALEERWAKDWLALGVLATQTEETPEQLDALAAELDAMAKDARALAVDKRAKSAESAQPSQKLP